MRIITHHDKVIIAPAVKKGAHFTSVMLSNINFHVTSQIFCSSIFSTPPKSFLPFLHLLLFFMFSLLYHSTWNNDSNTYVKNKTHLFQIKLNISQIQNLWNSAFIDISSYSLEFIFKHLSTIRYENHISMKMLQALWKENILAFFII